MLSNPRNADARGESSVGTVFSNDFWGNSLWDGGWTHKSYRPLVVGSYAIQYWFNGGDIKPQPLRAFNVALHTINSLMVYRLLRRHGASRSWACLSAGLFAAHPVHAENIIYLVGRADALATHCWLLALLSWPQPGRAGRISSRPRLCSRALRVCLAVVLAVIGGLCKESGFCVLLQLAVGELLGPHPVRGAAPLLGVFGLVFFGRSWLTDGTTAGFSFVDTPVQYHDNYMVRLCTYLYFHGKYAQLMVFPWTLSWDYSFDAVPLLRATFFDVRMLIALTAYLGVVSVAAWGFAQRSRSVLLGLSNVLIPFVVFSNLFFIVGVTVGERLLYPCNVGLALVVATTWGRERAASRQRWRPKLCLGLLLAAFVYLCGVRVFQWSSRDQLFGPDATAYPKSTKARHQYGTVLHRQGRFDEALVHFDAALQIFPDSALTEYCMSQILIETNRAEEAKSHLEHIFGGHALGFGSFNLYLLYIDYGFSLMLLGKFEEALPQLEQGLRMNEDVPHGLNALGYTYAQLRRTEDAAAAFEKGVNYEPDNPFLMNNLGVMRLIKGNLEAGADLMARALALDPNVQAFQHNAQLLQTMLAKNSWPGEQFVLELFFNRGG